jgi:hypothetical protein
MLFGSIIMLIVLKGTPVCELFEAQIRVITSSLIALNSVEINDGYKWS